MGVFSIVLESKDDNILGSMSSTGSSSLVYIFVLNTPSPLLLSLHFMLWLDKLLQEEDRICPLCLGLFPDTEVLIWPGNISLGGGR